MQPQTIGLIVGGLAPALLYGLTNVFSKSATQAGIGLGPYLIVIGITIAATGLLFGVVQSDWHMTSKSALHSIGIGITWGLGTGFVAIGLSTYSMPLGKLVPIYNMNTLVAVLLALWFFAEWQNVKVPQLLIGSLLIVIGGTLVARA